MCIFFLFPLFLHIYFFSLKSIFCHIYYSVVFIIYLFVFLLHHYLQKNIGKKIF
ncbi:hypothetical protein C1646_135691 [Rhizophagus diaphanus]|nr:hypothetical protein C1646_135691 [Rhizophagus diaphanus] [Rhizophagus sp. MUCL 43196]